MYSKAKTAKSTKRQPKNLGRPRAYTPEGLDAKFNEYKEYTKDNPFIKQVASKHGPMDIQIRRPLSLSGFCAFAGINNSTFYEYEGREDYSEIIARVRSEIEADQIDGAMAGVYDSSIVSRLLKLADRKDVTSNGETIRPAAPVSVILDTDAVNVIKSIGKGSMLPE